jgi:hypothetical protein
MIITGSLALIAYMVACCIGVTVKQKDQFDKHVES